MSNTPSPSAVIELPAAAIAAKKPNRRRHHFAHFRTDDSEHAELAARARQAGLSVDAFCRLKTLGKAGARSRRSGPTEESRLKAQHLAALNKVGNNFNQGTRALNEIAIAAHEGMSSDRLADEISAVRQLLQSVVPALNDTLAANRKALDYDWEG
jgi:hypothetical protein